MSFKVRRNGGYDVTDDDKRYKQNSHKYLYSIRNVLAPEAMTALYCRLSVDDANDGDSNSIQNQKKILLNYAKENGYLNTQFFVDDGYSGTSFERPSFKKMIEGIKSGEIKRVIIKDMSRFGRDYLQVGMYTEIMFAEYDIHFIAVNDGVDSQKEKTTLRPSAIYLTNGMPVTAPKSSGRSSG